jgi:PAS domain S-box-containing protein
MAAIVEFSGEAIFGRTLEGVITSWNPAAERMYGYSSEEILGQSVGLLIAESHAEEAKAVVAKVSAGQPVEHLETFNVRKDGTVFPISLTVSPIRDPAGAVVGASVICRDVTQQRQALAAAQRMAAIVEFSGEAIFGRTLDGIITSWNPAAERMYGYSSEEIVGKPINLLIPEDRTGEIEAILAKVSAGLPVEHRETSRVRRDGTAFPVPLTVSPINGTDGAVVGASVITRDLTEQKRALAVAQHLAAIVESSDDAIISGSLDGIITSWNPAAERMYGYSSAEIIGKPADFLTPADRTTEIEAVLEQIKAGQHVEHLSTKRVRKDCTVFPVSLTVSPIRDAEGAVIGTSVIHREVTEHK